MYTRLLNIFIHQERCGRNKMKRKKKKNITAQRKYNVLVSVGFIICYASGSDKMNF